MSNTYNPEIHHRYSIRLKNYDYSKPGAYFITLCTNNNEYLFGKLQNQQMILNEAGKMIDKVWSEIYLNYTDVKTDVYQIMPNHFHGIIMIKGNDAIAYDTVGSGVNKNCFSENALPVISLSEIVRYLK
jgi:hypothetical protein